MPLPWRPRFAEGGAQRAVVANRDRHTTRSASASARSLGVPAVAALMDAPAPVGSATGTVLGQAASRQNEPDRYLIVRPK
jgi:hypothetical protein